MKYWQFFLMMAAIYITPGMSESARICCAIFFTLIGFIAMVWGD
jgi:hypothetical protein